MIYHAGINRSRGCLKGIAKRLDVVKLSQELMGWTTAGRVVHFWCTPSFMAWTMPGGTDPFWCTPPLVG